LKSVEECQPFVEKEFRYDVPKVAPEVFFRTVKFWKDGEKAPAVFSEDGVNYLHIKVLLFWCKAHFVWAPPLPKPPLPKRVWLHYRGTGRNRTRDGLDGLAVGSRRRQLLFDHAPY
jgi:hypothetical protein